MCDNQTTLEGSMHGHLVYTSTEQWMETDRAIEDNGRKGDEEKSCLNTKVIISEMDK